MKFLLIGASKHIGYEASLRLLSKGHTCIYLLRNPSVFDSNEVIQNYVQQGKARLVKGDGLVEADVKNVWNIASEDGPIDFVLYSLGGTEGGFSLSQGFVVSPPNIVASALYNVLKNYPTSSPQPRLIMISGTGTTRAAYSQLPLPIRSAATLIQQPRADKLGAEKLISHSSGWNWDKRDVVRKGILEDGWEEGLPASGWLKSALVIRPVFLTDGPCRAEEEGKKGARVGEALSGAYTVSRKDVAYWIVESGIQEWEKWEGKSINMGY